MAHILVVDDERDVVTLIKFLLEKDGHTVAGAYNGKEALAVLGVEPKAIKEEKDRPDLILLDVMMPVMDGTEVVRRLEGVNGLEKVPMLVLSAKAQAHDVFTKSDRKIMYLEKPFDPKKLRLVIESILKGE